MYGLRDVVNMNAHDIAYAAVTVVCLAILTVSWRLLRTAERHLTAAKAILERDADPPRVTDGGKP